MELGLPVHMEEHHSSYASFLPLQELDIHHKEQMDVEVKNLHRTKASVIWFRIWKQQDKFKRGLNTTLAFTQGLGQIS